MLEEAVESVDRQNMSTEYIIVTDDNQRGPAWARNRGLERSKNRLVAFLDADDRWKPSKLSRQIRRMDETGCGLCVEGEPRSTEQFIEDLLIGEIGSLTPSALIDTTQTSARFDESLPRREDHLFLIECATSAGVCLLPDLVEVRKHSSGLTAENTPEVRREAAEKFALRVESVLGTESFSRYENRYWAEFYHQQGRLRYRRHDGREAVASFLRSLQLRPRSKTVLALCAALLGPIGRWAEGYR